MSAGRVRFRYRHLRARGLRRLRPPLRVPGVRILCYHRVADADDPLAVAPARFREQMQQIAASGARLVGLRDVPRLLAGRLDEPCVCVTLDDGYRDNLQHAVPALRELGIPATIFLPVHVLDGTAAYGWYDSPPPALTWAEVRALQDEGTIDFGCHTLTHPCLPDVDDARAHDEIVTARAVLEERLGRPVTAFAYPAGRHGPRELALVAAAGYGCAVTTTPGLNGPGASPFALRRTVIDRGDDRVLFAAALDGLLDAVDPLPRLLRRVGLLRA